MQRRSLLLSSLALPFGGCALNPVAGASPVAADFMIPAGDAGVQLYLRNKRPRRLASAAPERTVLFVHGLTYSGAAFDLPLGGQSWMDRLAARGFDTWAMDVRGYGRSTQLPQMAQPPDANPPLLDAQTATRDVAAAVDFIREQRGVPRVAIVGWSWGTVLAGKYATEHPTAVERLVLYAPVWKWPDAPTPKAPPGAYRSVTRDAARRSWLNGVPEYQQGSLIPAGWFEQWADANWALDADGAKQNPPVMRAPNGPLVEVIEHWASGRTFYDPARIVAPTLVTVAEWDRVTPRAMARELLPLLTNALERRLVVIEEGTHQVFLERNRERLFDAVQAFLEAR